MVLHHSVRIPSLHHKRAVEVVLVICDGQGARPYDSEDSVDSSASPEDREGLALREVLLHV